MALVDDQAHGVGPDIEHGNRPGALDAPLGRRIGVNAPELVQSSALRRLALQRAAAAGQARIGHEVVVRVEGLSPPSAARTRCELPSGSTSQLCWLSLR